MSVSRPSRGPDPAARWPRVVIGASLCAAITLLLWPVLDAVPLVVGTAIGVIGGISAGTVAAARRVLVALRTAVVLALTWAVAAATTRTVRGPLEVPETITTFLTIGVPASGLDGLATVAAVVAFPATALTTWAALRRYSTASVAGWTIGLVCASLLGAARDVPLPALAGVGAALLALLFTIARSRRDALPPLTEADAPAATRRWPGALLIAAAGVGVGVGITLAPHRDAFDLRRYVTPEVFSLVDDNPLAAVARLQTEPPPDARDVDVTVTVEGASPGRMRLAVMDGYAPTGWIQQATFANTGRALADSPLYGQPGRATSIVTVSDSPGTNGMRATPTAGQAVRIADPNGVVYAPTAGVLIHLAGGEVVYRAVPMPGTVPSAMPSPARIVSGVPATMYDCPDSAAVRTVAEAMRVGTTDPLEILRRTESWLKLTRVYDPRSLGGQTLASIELFAGVNLARGNMEAFVSTFALVARCAGVPTRVVVGYPQPAANSITQYRADQLQAWVEVPLDGVQWLVFDPVPSPSEQQRQAELAGQPPVATGAPLPTPPPATQVAATSPSEDRVGRWWWIVLAVVVVLTALAALVVGLLGALTTRRRRRTGEPGAATLAAWDHTVDRLVDRGVPLLAHHTPTEVGLATNGRIPRRASQLIGRLAPLVDKARFDPPGVTTVDAATAWALSASIVEDLPLRGRRRWAAVTHPRRTVERWRATGRVSRRASPWSGVLPPKVPEPDDATPAHIPGVVLDGQIGAGSTSVVYRGHLVDDGRPVAVKIYRFSVDDRPFDRQRFEWEARIAATVSGQLNLPEIYAAGITEAARPYLVSKLYARGSLSGRVQRGGRLSAGEILTLGRALALALDRLHITSILHGDVAPENVFIADDGTPILGDLGGAWVRAEGGPASSMTPPYAAPELWLGQHPSRMSDLYSLGLTLMFCATGRAPTAGAPPQANDVLDALGSEIYLPLLEIDPRRRPRTALDAARLLGADVDDPSLLARAAVVLPTPTIIRRPLDPV